MSQSSAKGYAGKAYAYSLTEFGEPIHLPRCGGYLLRRAIPGTGFFDAMGCYPLFFCRDWKQLCDDLEELPPEIISVSLVADPYGHYSPDELEQCFEVVNPFKVHYVVDLELPQERIGSDHHRKQALASLDDIQVEVCKDPPGFAEKWTEIYQTLARRHNIHGIRAFSQTAFEQQLAMPEIEVLLAFLGDEIIGAQLYFVQDDVVHCHLGAVSDHGYKAGAFYAMDYVSFDHFAGRAKWLDIGGGAGLSGSGQDGLSLYKKGWSSRTRPVYFCGKIVNPEAYRDLAPLQGQEETNYFPAYRLGEFS
ncbi:GNAT family N-acetyltransferase [Pontiella sp.]